MEAMGERTKGMLLQSAPWRRGVPWWLVGVQGLALLAIGIYLLADSEGGRDTIRQLVGAILLLNCLLVTYAGFRNRTRAVAPFLVLRGGVGLTVGLIVLLEPISDYLNEDASRYILGWGLLATGLIALAGIVVSREEDDLRIGALVVAGLTAVVGILFLTGSSDSSARIATLGAIAVLAGLLLIAFAAWLYRGATQAGSSPIGSTPGGTAGGAPEKG